MTDLLSGKTALVTGSGRGIVGRSWLNWQRGVCQLSSCRVARVNSRKPLRWCAVTGFRRPRSLRI